MKNKRSNIIFILSDDHGAWAMRNAGNTDITTPNLDRLVMEGVRFDNFFCVSPVCSPARASILTGRIPSQHGIHDFIAKGNLFRQNGEFNRPGIDRPIQYLEGFPGYTEYLAQSGYDCGLVGKWHLGDSGQPQKGFNSWYAYAFGGGDYCNYQIFEEGKIKTETNYITDQITAKAIEYIDKNKNNTRPFYLGVHYTAPHSPWSKDNHPDEIWALYDDCEFKATPNLPLHPWQRHFFDEESYCQEKRREFLHGYYTAVTAMDHNIGRIMEVLDKDGLRENTIVIFTSDNGMCMGHHGVWGKGNGTFPLNMYDSSVKVPFIVSSPELLPENVVYEGLYSHYDIFPTLLDFLDIENPVAEELPGRSFASLLHGLKDEGNDAVVIFDEYGPVRMIRNKDWKYIHRYPYGPHEFYDLTNDPNEDNNLINDINNADQVDHMRGMLQNWFDTYVDPRRDGAHEPVTGDGQINLVGPSNKGRYAFDQKQAGNLNSELWNRYFD